jgi:hypothetical protein
VKNSHDDHSRVWALSWSDTLDRYTRLFDSIALAERARSEIVLKVLEFLDPIDSDEYRAEITAAFEAGDHERVVELFREEFDGYLVGLDIEECRVERTPIVDLVDAPKYLEPITCVVSLLDRKPQLGERGWWGEPGMSVADVASSALEHARDSGDGLPGWINQTPPQAFTSPDEDGFVVYTISLKLERIGA